MCSSNTCRLWKVIWVPTMSLEDLSLVFLHQMQLSLRSGTLLHRMWTMLNWYCDDDFWSVTHMQTIDTKGESVELSVAKNVEPSSLSTLLPRDTPCYVLYRNSPDSVCMFGMVALIFMFSLCILVSRCSKSALSNDLCINKEYLWGPCSRVGCEYY